MKIFPLIIFLAFTIFANAQSIKRNTLSSFGSSTSLTGQTLSQSVGQPSNVTSSSSSNLTIRQGFQQPVNKIVYDETEKCNISVFPNPSYDGLVEIKSDNNFNNINKYYIHNAAGSLVYNSVLNNNQTDMNLRFLAPGLYIIVFENDENLNCNTKLIIGNK